jgi:squalene-hopene/tetraprenyl-beta-curcumene cyclase
MTVVQPRGVAADLDVVIDLRDETLRRAALGRAVDRAVDHLRRTQDTEGWWKGELVTNVTMEAEDLLMREFLGIRTDQVTDETARWIRSQQRADGTWATFPGGPAEISTTAEAWVALRLAGDDPEAPHMAAAAAYVRSQGGLERTRVFTRIWLALFGLWSWDDLPELPPEVALLPSWSPVSIYDFGCWARQTVVPLTIVATHRPARPLGVTVDELRTGLAPEPTAPLLTWAGAFQRLDKGLKAYGRRPLRVLRARALRVAEQWVLDRQEADGSWGGIQPPWVYSILALHLQGHALDSPAVAAGLAGLDRFTVREQTADGWVRRLEACQSPIWDSCLAQVALLDAGVPADDPALEAVTSWLLAEEISVPGDWSVRRPRLTPGGWAFEFDNDRYPDVDDTAEVVLGLRRMPGAAAAAALQRGVDWVLGMQSKDGGWGAFDVDNTRRWPTRLPFCDFGEVVDPPSADVTAHVVEMLAEVGQADTEPCRRGVRWLMDHQEARGSWFGRWGANHLYGTGAAVPALVAAGVDRQHPAVRRAVAWLESVQQPDGTWGEDLRSYRDDAWIGVGDATPSQTAWALLALLAADGDSPAIQRGLDWLVRTQRTDGTWDEDRFTGTGFPGDFLIGYEMYRHVFPLSALGRALHSTTGPTS